MTKEEYLEVLAQYQEKVNKIQEHASILNDAENLREEIQEYASKIEDDEDLSEGEIYELVDDFYDVGYDATSWLPSSYQC